MTDILVSAAIDSQKHSDQLVRALRSANELPNLEDRDLAIFAACGAEGFRNGKILADALKNEESCNR